MGIGGAYLCVYGMEGPGGYQFVGRTLQMWSRYHEVADFAGKPAAAALFRPVAFLSGLGGGTAGDSPRFPTRTLPAAHRGTARCGWRSTSSFSLARAQSISAFRDHQQRAFNDERERWIASGGPISTVRRARQKKAGDAPLQPGNRVESPVSGNLWQVQTAVGRRYVPAMCWWCLSR